MNKLGVSQTCVNIKHTNTCLYDINWYYINDWSTVSWNESKVVSFNTIVFADSMLIPVRYISSLLVISMSIGPDSIYLNQNQQLTWKEPNFGDDSWFY